VAKLCVLIFDRIQGYHLHKEAQLLAIAAAFTLMADAMKVPPQDAFTAVKNLMADPEHKGSLRAQFAAMAFHLEDELLGKGA
jgi:aminopeptidase N